MSDRLIDTENGIASYYEAEAEVSYDSLDWRNRVLERRRTEIILSLLGAEFIPDVLDVGCGEGWLLGEIRKRNSSALLAGIDVSATRLRRASNRVAGGSILQLASATDPNGINLGRQFSSAVCSEVLEHLPQPNVALINIYRVMKKQGLIVVSVPYAEKLVYVRCSICGQLTTTGHINSFDEESLAELMQDSGFKVESVKGYKVFPIPLIERYLTYQWWNTAMRLLSWRYKHVRPYYLIAVGRKSE